MRNNREYQICKDIALYMKLQYPNVLYRFDMAGLNLSIAQAGMNKAIQCRRGWPDFFIAESKTMNYDNGSTEIIRGLFIEVKKEDTLIWTAKGKPTTPHIAEQIKCLNDLCDRGYLADFGRGFDDCKKMIDEYLQ